MSRYLGFDFGKRRIGVAVGQTITGTASALETVHCAKLGKPPWEQIEALIQQWRPTGLVVGLPLTMDGSEQEITHAARAFAAELKRFDVPVATMDERLSSREAESAYKLARQQGQAKRSQSKNLDSQAARVILERWLAGQ